MLYQVSRSHLIIILVVTAVYAVVLWAIVDTIRDKLPKVELACH